MIDEAPTRAEVREISLGDYVLNGGEVAALAITEAVVRLVPGFMGNAESLVEESHEDGLLEYPVFTKPASWRGRDVPPVLLSGDHARDRGLARDQAVRRTAARRPDLAHPAARSLDDSRSGPAGEPADAGELFVLHPRLLGRGAARQPRRARSPRCTRRSTTCPRASPAGHRLVARSAGRLVGAVRGRRSRATAWDIGRLMVAPDLAGRGLGRELLERIEAPRPAGRRRTRSSPAPAASATADVQEGRLPAARRDPEPGRRAS